MDFDNMTTQNTPSVWTDAGMTLESTFNQGVDAFAGYFGGLDEDERAHLEAVVYEYAI